MSKLQYVLISLKNVTVQWISHLIRKLKYPFSLYQSIKVMIAEFDHLVIALGRALISICLRF